MAGATNMTIGCPFCGHQFDAIIDMVVDASADPQAKARLLTGQHNNMQCPNCGQQSHIATPLVYHDANKELLITFVPMELGLPKDEQEKMLGDLIRQVTSRLPQESLKGYIFQPQQALTMQGLVEQILGADGVTPEMIAEQRAKAQLVEQFIQASEDQIPGMVEEYDEQLEAGFFQAMTLVVQRLLQEGLAAEAQHVVELQGQLAELTTYGQEIIKHSQLQEQIIQEVAEAVNALGQDAQIEDFVSLVFDYADDDERLQALVGLVRPAFDYMFFQALTARIGQAPAEERAGLEAMRERLLQFIDMIDQQAQIAAQSAAGLLQTMLQSDNPDEVIELNLPMIDNTFMALLAMNIQEAEKNGDLQATGQLKHLYERVIEALQANMQPELRFVNELLMLESDSAAHEMLAEHAADFGPELVEIFDNVGRILADNGDEALLERLTSLRQTLS